jgi:nitroimidazol reductase NimA-like FMN-containing flavoprotein (pyridoxamine 5'-phosphate oxidase superfamily)
MDVLDGVRSRDLLDEAPYAVIAVTSRGRPYVTPISFVRNGELLCFRSGPGERMDALRADPAACISIVAFHEDTGRWESVLVRGDVSFVADEEECAGVVERLLAKYRRFEPALGIALPELAAPDAVTFTVPISDMTGRSSGSSPVPRTRPGRL